jgi:hypothetical protein
MNIGKPLKHEEQKGKSDKPGNTGIISPYMLERIKESYER